VNIGPYLKQCASYNAEIKVTYWMYYEKFYMTAISINKIMPTQKVIFDLMTERGILQHLKCHRLSRQTYD
jgi:hypothetical protein